MASGSNVRIILDNRHDERVTGLQAKGDSLASEGKFLGGRRSVYESAGRLQLEVLIHEGLYPSSSVCDVGCGSLRGAYWIIHFVDPGHYFGIEPHEDRVAIGLSDVLEPGFAETAQPTFAYNDDFNLGVFDRKFDFVIARSVWTHASKRQIETMLDSFVEVGTAGSLLLVSYHRASRLRRPVHEARPRATGPWYRLSRRLLGRPTRRGDYQGEVWQAGNVSHSWQWIRDACARRHLRVRELDYGVVSNQVWLRIEHP